MAQATKVFPDRPNVRGRLVITLVDQQIAANTSRVRTQLFAEETSQQPTYHLDNNLPWSCSGIPGGTYSGNWHYDFRPSGNQSYTLLNSVRTVTHNADGTMSISGTAAIQGDILGNITGLTVNLVLPRIPRGPKLKYEGEYKNTVAYIKTAGEYKIAIPYLKSDGQYKIGGG